MSRQQTKWLEEGLAKFKAAIDSNHDGESNAYMALKISREMIRQGKVFLHPKVVAANTVDDQSAIAANWLIMRTFGEDFRC